MIVVGILGGVGNIFDGGDGCVSGYRGVRLKTILRIKLSSAAKTQSPHQNKDIEDDGKLLALYFSHRYFF